jgi:hypothetical protein
MEIFDNRVLSSGRLADGRSIAAQNVGIYIWDGLGSGVAGFYNNRGHDNLVGWMKNGQRNDWWIPDATSFTNNTSWPGTLTTGTEDGELIQWQAKLSAGGIAVGPIY